MNVGYITNKGWYWHEVKLRNSSYGNCQSTQPNQVEKCESVDLQVTLTQKYNHLIYVVDHNINVMPYILLYLLTNNSN